MSKLLLLFLCALMLLLEPVAAVAAPREAATTEVAASPGSRIGHRPNYKKYRGNSRHRPKKLGVFRRYFLYRKAKKKRAARHTPSVKVGRPVRTSK
ncbi:hypothetical protein HMJ29_06760 [Hymenobacter taeanensis]|uniref:Uncharacterized protein n=1 Tax=Hymenobacter taeanensis TaxID=2735321 RepID=A0A6M6BFZ3_9BACT|nr:MULTISPECIES: hypothetical protein [Hymenobacter]QJX46654.1 hypothetical protein HMJ29_06760 [Hymenobacter taeanensis]UOQ80517.1 hypothetical protein MUN83_17095 [Hymenobacter sp. 5414T-23]